MNRIIYINEDNLLNIFSYLIDCPSTILGTIWDKNGNLNIIYDKEFIKKYQYIIFKLMSDEMYYINTYNKKIDYLIDFHILYNNQNKTHNINYYLKFIYDNYVTNFGYNSIISNNILNLLQDINNIDVYLNINYHLDHIKILTNYIHQFELCKLQMEYIKKIKFWTLYFKHYLMYINNDLSLFKVSSLLNFIQMEYNTVHYWLHDF